MTSLNVIGADAQGRYLKLGDIVRMCSDVAHLYDDTGDRWIIDGTDAEFNAPGVLRSAPPAALARQKASATLKIRNLTTGIWVHAPAAWVLPVSDAPSAAGQIDDELGVLAKLIVDQPAQVAVIAAICHWARGYIARKGASEAEPLFPSGSMQAALERLPKRQHDCGVPPAIMRVLEKYEFKVLEAERNFVDAVAGLIDERFAKAERYDDLKARFDAIAKAMGNV